MSVQPFSRRWRVTQYWPNQPLNAVRPETCIAGLNTIFEAEGYSRLFGGWGDLSETHAPGVLAYTADTTSNNTTVNFPAGTLLADCVPYQHVLLGRELFLLVKLVSNTQAIVSPAPTATVSGLTVTRVPNLHPIMRTQGERLSQYAGSAIRYREEAIFSVGRGPLRINGVTLTPSSLVASSTPQVAYPLSGGGYDVRPVGFTRPTAPTVTAIAGGTKAMAAHDYTFRASKKRAGFPGHGLASAPVRVTLAAGQRFSVTFAVFDATEGQTSAYLWVSRTDDAASAEHWQLYGEFSTVGAHNVEWYDAELGEVYSDDNDPPPPALYVASANDYLIFASFGDAPDGSLNQVAPGPGIAVSRHNNPEAFSPEAWTYVSPAEEIVGVVTGKVGVRTQDAMAFFLTGNYLHVGRFTDSSISPLVTLPYAAAGFQHQYSGVIAYDYFYGLAGNTFVRTTDGANVETGFSTPIATDLRGVKSARCFVGVDPSNGWVVLFEANAVVGSGGKYQTKAWSLNLKTERWNTPVLLGDGITDDFTVCGVATVSSKLCFLTTDGKAWQWDTGAGLSAGWMAVGFDDFGGSQYVKTIRRAKPNGSFNGSLKLYFDFDYSNLVAGTGSPASKTFPNPLYSPLHHPIWSLNRHCASMAWRLDYTIPAGLRILDDLEIQGAFRDGFVR